MVRDELVNIGLGEQIIQIEKDVNWLWRKVWDKKRLQTLLEITEKHLVQNNGLL